MRIALVCPFDPAPVGPPGGIDAQGQAPGDGRKVRKPDKAGKAAHVGGVERVFHELSRALADRGHDVTIVASTPGRPPAAVRRDRVRHVRGRRVATVLRTPVARLAHCIPREAEVVHVAATYPFTTGPALRTARRRGAATVLDFHFEPVPDSTAGRLAAAIYRHVDPPYYGLADAVVVRSLAYAANAPSLQGIAPTRLRVVPNGLDTERFCPEGETLHDDALLFVGRLVPYKGLDVLLDAVAKARPEERLVLAGDGPLRSRLERRARRLGIDATFLGRVSDTDLPRLYRGARLTTLPSINRQEAFGMVLVESMACGTPVLASDLPGVGDVARLGGWVSRPGDADDLARRLRMALDEAPRLHGQALARRIHDTFSWPAIARRFEAVYDEALALHQARHTVPHAHPGGDPVL